MTKIGLLSDTHGFFDPALNHFFKDCDEIWHAGDIGNQEVIEAMPKGKECRIVYGNIDGGDLRLMYKEFLFFEVEGMKVLIKHIGGYPGRYDRSAIGYIEKFKPDIFISGHSHILKVMNDKRRKILHINPGACGNSGFHSVKTAVRFTIDNGRVADLEIWEKERR